MQQFKIRTCVFDFLVLRPGLLKGEDLLHLEKEMEIVPKTSWFYKEKIRDDWRCRNIGKRFAWKSSNVVLHEFKI
jgi:hypothetical protein